MKFMRFRGAMLAASALILPSAAWAQDAQPAEPDSHGDTDDEIIVTARFVENLDVLAGTSVLSDEKLATDMRPQLGDTLTKLPGVSATSFSPGASRPVLRGFQGARVGVFTDGIGALDASASSADHAVSIDPLTAERIEVLRGPAVLLFGSQAVGGAVNVIDKRIPRAIPDEPVHVTVIGALGTAADERSIGGAVEIPLAGKFVLHVDGGWRKADDMRSGGYVLSPSLRAEQLAIAEEETEEGHPEEAAEATGLANLRGKIPNTALESTSAGVGVSYINDWGSIGFSLSGLDTDYGIPSRPGAGHHHDEEGEGEAEGEEAPVTIGLKQRRADMRAEINTGGGFFKTITLRAGATDYKHTEFEGDEIGTIFLTKGVEGRLELIQSDRGGWHGAIGAQVLSRRNNAIGAEAFVPRTLTDQFGVFAVQEYHAGPVGIEGAVRYERSSVAAPDLGITRKFNSFSGAGSLTYDVSSSFTVGLTGTRTERAPVSEELFSNGPHIATQAYEIGNPDFGTEKSWGVEAFVRGHSNRLTVSASAYVSWFDGFIFDAATGDEIDELPVFQYQQFDARFWGFEAQASFKLIDTPGFGLTIDGVGDYVRATLSGGAGPVPRIPPLRLLGGIETEMGNFGARAEIEWTSAQNRVATTETPTEGFTLVNASVSWKPWGKDSKSSLVLSADNIFDVEARRHASFTKDFVPLAGRDIRLSLRFAF